MEDINQIFEMILQLAGIIIPLASVYVAMTETPEDDKLYGKLYKFIEMLAIVTNKTKQIPPNQKK